MYILGSLVLFSESWFQNTIVDVLSQSKNKMFIIFSLLCLLASIGLPRQIVAFICGYFFDIHMGLLLAMLIITTATMITYMTSNFLRKSTKALITEPVVVRIAYYLSEDTFYKSVIIRLMPIGSNFLTNIFAGITQIPFIPFILGSSVGFIPQVFIFSLAGSGVKFAANEHLIISGALFAISILLGGLVYQRTTLNQKKSD
jgi:uncharacterized membrane protein YdjX (TVP38/TMEM64 family)